MWGNLLGMKILGLVGNKKFLGMGLTVLVSLMMWISPQGALAAPSISSLNVGTSPTGIVSAGSKTYVLNASSISVVDSATNALITTITPPALGSSFFAEGVYVASDQSVWVTRYASTGQVLRISTVTDTVTDTFSSLSGPFGIAASATKIYVALNASDQIAVFDIASKTSNANLNYNSSGNANSPYRLAVAGDKLIIIQGSGAFLVPWTISTATQGSAVGLSQIIDYDPVVSPDGSTVYFGIDTAVYALNVSTNAVTTYLSGITDARGLALSSDGSVLFIGRQGSIRAVSVSNPNTTLGEATLSSATAMDRWQSQISLIDSGQALLVSETSDNKVERISLDPTLVETNSSLPVNQSASITAPTAVGFWSTPVYSSTALPTGLTLDSNTGAISGTPSSAQSPTNVTITATTALFVRTTTFTIEVTGITPTPTPTPTPSPASDSSTLANTGVSVLPTVLIALVLLSAGVSLVSLNIFLRRKNA